MAAHIDHQIRTATFEPRMLSYQPTKKAPEEPPLKKDIYSVLDKWLIKYVENNTNVITSQEVGAKQDYFCLKYHIPILLSEVGAKQDYFCLQYHIPILLSEVGAKQDYFCLQYHIPILLSEVGAKQDYFCLQYHIPILLSELLHKTTQRQK